jgi:hypothetical protein
MPKRFQKLLVLLETKRNNTVDIRYSQRAMYGATMPTQKSKKTN